MGCRQFLGLLDEQRLALIPSFNSDNVSTSDQLTIVARAGSATAKQHAATNVAQSNCAFRIEASSRDIARMTRQTARPSALQTRDTSSPL
jgi:hypothetical protein